MPERLPQGLGAWLGPVDGLVLDGKWRKTDETTIANGVTTNQLPYRLTSITADELSPNNDS